MSHSNASILSFSKNFNNYNTEAKHRRVKSTNDFEFLKFKNVDNPLSQSERNDFLLYSSQTVASGFYPKRLKTEEKSSSQNSVTSVKQLDQSYQIEDQDHTQSHSRSKLDSSEGRTDGQAPIVLSLSNAHPFLQQQNIKSPSNDDNKRLIIEYLDDVNPPQREFQFGAKRITQLGMGFLGAPQEAMVQTNSLNKNIIGSPKRKEWKLNESEIAEEDEDYRSNHPSLGNIGHIEIKKGSRIPGLNYAEVGAKKSEVGNKRLEFIEKIFSKKKDSEGLAVENIKHKDQVAFADNKIEEISKDSAIQQSDESSNYQQPMFQVKPNEIKMISQKQEKMERLKKERINKNDKEAAKNPNTQENKVATSNREMLSIPTSAPQVSINGVPKRVEVSLKNEKKSNFQKETIEFLNKQRMNNNLMKQSLELNMKMQNYILKNNKRQGPLEESQNDPANNPSLIMDKKLLADSNKAIQNNQNKVNRTKTISNPVLLNFLNYHHLPESIKHKANMERNDQRQKVASMNILNMANSAVTLNHLDTRDSQIDLGKTNIPFHLVSPGGGGKMGNSKLPFTNNNFFNDNVQINLLNRLDKLEEDVDCLRKTIRSIEENGNSLKKEVEHIRGEAMEMRELYNKNFNNIEKSIERHGEWLKSLDKFVSRFQEYFERISIDRSDSYQNEISTSDSHYELLKPNTLGFSNLASKIKFQEEMSQNITPRIDSMASKPKNEKRK